MTDFNEKLVTALEHVGFRDGLEFYEDEGIVVVGKAINNYLAVLYLARLLKDGQIEIRIAPSKIDYLLKLLGIKEE